MSLDDDGMTCLCRTDVTAEFQKLVDCADGILSLQKLQREDVVHMARLDGQKKLLQEVIATGNNHPVFHAQARWALPACLPLLLLLAVCVPCWSLLPYAVV